jgi:hypothetical protein
MHEKMRKRVTMNEVAETKVNNGEPFLKGSPKHENGHPYSFDRDKYINPIPIAKDLSDQIAMSRPKDNMQSLLKIPPNIFANFVKMA